MTLFNKFDKIKQYIFPIIKWSIFSLVIGVLGGLLGAGFHHTLHFVTATRETYNWLLYFLPFGGLLTVCIYRLLKLQSNKGTNEVITSVLEGNSVSPLVTPAIFSATAITHLFGGSAGREGAALQLGGSLASLINKIFRFKKEDSKVMTICGMGAVFSGLFSMPLTSCLFTLEFESVGTVFYSALLPCFLSTIIASKVSSLLGVSGITAIQKSAVSFDFENIWRITLLSVLIALLGIFMCYVFHGAGRLAKNIINNPYLRISVGSLAVVILTLLVGDQRFNGAGMEMAVDAISKGNAAWYYFLLKIIFTALTLSIGFKGGEIVPTFCIGATFGCVVGGFIGMDPGFAASLGLVGLFCAATNSPLASIILSLEMFGITNLYVFVLVCVITFALSSNSSLYDSQVMEFSKSSMNRNNI